MPPVEGRHRIRNRLFFLCCLLVLQMTFLWRSPLFSVDFVQHLLRQNTTTAHDNISPHQEQLNALVLLTRNHSDLDCQPPLVHFYDIPAQESFDDDPIPARKIPRFIHLSTKSRCIHPEQVKILYKWHDAFPYDTVLLHDDDAVDRLINEGDWAEFPLLKEIYNHCLVMGGAIMVDIWRLLITYRYGGLYADFDEMPGPELRESALAPDYGFFALSDSWSRPSQWLFASEPGHPVLVLTLHVILKNVLALENVKLIKPVFITGPHAMWHGFRQFVTWNTSNADGTKNVGSGGGSYYSHGYSARKIAKLKTPSYVRNTRDVIVEYQGQNTSLKSMIQSETNMLHWTKSLNKSKQNNTKSGSCAALLNVSDSDYSHHHPNISLLFRDNSTEG